MIYLDLSFRHAQMFCTTSMNSIVTTELDVCKNAYEKPRYVVMSMEEGTIFDDVKGANINNFVAER